MEYFDAVFSNIWSISLAIVFLGLSIFVHELGHFLAARKRGMKVERFSIGFGPKIVSWTGKDGVEYRLSWLPLGGYVALPQLADMGAIEGEAKTDVSKLPPISYTTKVIVASAGAFFNVLFAFLLATIVWIVGQQVAVEEQTGVIGSVRQTVETSDGKTVPGPAFAAGLKAGDTVLAVDGKAVSTFTDIYERIVLGSGRDENGEPRVALSVKRGDATFDINVSPVYVTNDRIREIGISLSAKIIAAEIIPDSAAAAAGLKAGDILTHIDGAPITSPGVIREHVALTKENPVIISYVRDDKPGTLTLVPRYENNPDTSERAYLIGIKQAFALTPSTAHIPPWTQIVNVVTRTWSTLASLVNPRSDIGLDKMSGPIGIVTLISSAAKSDIVVVFSLLVLINVSLAIFNMLPIPVLDGGHILFATIGKLRGRPLPASFIMTTQSVFMILLFSMMIYVSFFDVRRNLPQTKAPPVPVEAQPAPEK